MHKSNFENYTVTGSIFRYISKVIKGSRSFWHAHRVALTRELADSSNFNISNALDEVHTGLR